MKRGTALIVSLAMLALSVFIATIQIWFDCDGQLLARCTSPERDKLITDVLLSGTISTIVVALWVEFKD